MSRIYSNKIYGIYSNRTHIQKVTPGRENVLTLPKPVLSHTRYIKVKGKCHWIVFTTYIKVAKCLAQVDLLTFKNLLWQINLACISGASVLNNKHLISGLEGINSLNNSVNTIWVEPINVTIGIETHLCITSFYSNI